MKITKRRITAADDDFEEMDVMDEDAGEVEIIDPEATDLLFETEDVAQLMAEVTGEDVDVTAEGDEVTFGIGEDEFTVTAEGDEEILESSNKKLRSKKPVSASRKASRVSASKNVRPSKTTYRARH